MRIYVSSRPKNGSGAAKLQGCISIFILGELTFNNRVRKAPRTELQ
jgi:hypothetical protein